MILSWTGMHVERLWLAYAVRRIYLWGGLTLQRDSIMKSLASLYLEALEKQAQETRFVIGKAADADLDFRPREDMRSLAEVANHLAQIPQMDYKFFTSMIQTFEQAQELEKGLWANSVPGMIQVFDDGMAILRDAFNQMSDEEFLDMRLKPFYETGDPKNWAHFLPEMMTHMAMHKMQLWVYLKLQGLPVTMWTYYGMENR
ncbi:MAG: DinB family protein [Candidatus Thorarchaeota archaeon]